MNSEEIDVLSDDILKKFNSVKNIIIEKCLTSLTAYYFKFVEKQFVIM